MPAGMPWVSTLPRLAFFPFFLVALPTAQCAAVSAFAAAAFVRPFSFGTTQYAVAEVAAPPVEVVVPGWVVPVAQVAAWSLNAPLAPLPATTLPQASCRTPPVLLRPVPLN